MLATKIKMHRAQKSPVQLLASYCTKEREGGEMPFVFFFLNTALSRKN